MIIPTGTLIAIVDGEKLQLFENIGHADIKLKALSVGAIEERASGASGRQSSGANPDNDTQAEDGFAVGVANAINARVLNGKVDNLLVIAAPKTLGQLRKGWHKQTESKLVGEIAKDLTGHSTEDIETAIQKA